jgi:hypothetical protein
VDLQGNVLAELQPPKLRLLRSALAVAASLALLLLGWRLWDSGSTAGPEIASLDQAPTSVQTRVQRGLDDESSSQTLESERFASGGKAESASEDQRIGFAEEPGIAGSKEQSDLQGSPGDQEVLSLSAQDAMRSEPPAPAARAPLPEEEAAKDAADFDALALRQEPAAADGKADGAQVLRLRVADPRAFVVELDRDLAATRGVPKTAGRSREAKLGAGSPLKRILELTAVELEKLQLQWRWRKVTVEPLAAAELKKWQTYLQQDRSAEALERRRGKKAASGTLRVLLLIEAQQSPPPTEAGDR